MGRLMLAAMALIFTGSALVVYANAAVVLTGAECKTIRIMGSLMQTAGLLVMLLALANECSYEKMREKRYGHMPWHLKVAEICKEIAGPVGKELFDALYDMWFFRFRNMTKRDFKYFVHKMAKFLRDNMDEVVDLMLAHEVF